MKKLSAETRQSKSAKSVLRSLRKSGRLPSAVYGKHETPRAVHVDRKDVMKLTAGGQTELLEMEVKGEGVFPVMLVDVQRDALTGEWLHADFHHVSMDEPVRTKVPIEIVGTAPGTKSGGLLQVQETHAEIEALPQHLPPHLEADISKLDVGDKLIAGELAVPNKVKLLSDPDELILSVIVPRAARETSEAVEDAEEEETQEAG